MAIPAEVQDLLDNPREALHVELKEWVNLPDPVARAKTARHLCALANHGGGYLIFGFTDEGTPAGPPPADLARYNRDGIASIIDRYLTPTFQCDAFVVSRTAGGDACVVVRVPSHGAVPVCAKANGPEVNGKIEGIRKGQHYIRIPGPKSVAIETPEQWQALIHRCVMSDRENLLGSIGNLFRAHTVPTPPPEMPLRAWHDAMRKRFLEQLQKNPHAWPVPLAKNFYQLSYRIIETGGKSEHTAMTLSEAIRVANESVRNVVWTGWSMFYQFSRAELAPRIVIDKTTGEETEAVETSLLNETTLQATLPDFWRITADGRATLLRAYREDRATNPQLAAKGLQPGKWLAPRELVREVYELASHAKEMAKAFAHATSVELRCSWYGLHSRRIGDFDPGVDWDERTCHAEERTTTVTVSVEQLIADTASVAVELYEPVLRLFDGLELDREWIVREMPKFRSL
jgi:hypothetical protein